MRMNTRLVLARLRLLRPAVVLAAVLAAAVTAGATRAGSAAAPGGPKFSRPTAFDTSKPLRVLAKTYRVKGFGQVPVQRGPAGADRRYDADATGSSLGSAS